ncbi:MAG: tetratricopeptide repeat protein [Bacteroidales bacterium]|nr:tetratricopeptide repeat protein [Bacteroidales bacterium]
MADNNHEALRHKLIEYYTYGPFKPEVTIKDNLVIIELDTSAIIHQESEYRKAVAFCERGRYPEAKEILDKLIKANPTNSEYHRIYGQILSDQGKVEEAIDSLIDALRWDPRNSYALLMMGNILARSKDDIGTAMKYFNKVLEINPKDNIAVNNIGANLMHQGKLELAKDYFNKALAIDPDYPNTHFGLAMIAEQEGDLSSAFFSATEALRKSKAKDGLYKQALQMAVQYAGKLIQEGPGQKIFKEYLHKLEFEGNIIIKALADDSIPTAAKMDLAENYGRDHHVIRYKSNYPAREHLMMHELVHIDLMNQARKAGTNQLFTSTGEHKRNYITGESEWIRKMNRMGMTEDSISKVISDLFEGLNRQVYNTPIDLFIEDYLYREYPDLRPYQFLSLFNLNKEAVHVTISDHIAPPISD